MSDDLTPDEVLAAEGNPITARPEAEVVVALRVAVKQRDQLRNALEAAQQRIAELERATQELHIIFDEGPGRMAGRFIEVETPDGRSVSVGRWEQQGNFWHLILRSAILA